MRVVVTGANGFVGRELCRRLAMDGCRVSAIIRGASAGVERYGGVYRLDPRDRRATLAAALEGAEAVVHLAGHAHRGEAVTAESRAAFWRTNVEYSREVLEAAARCGVGHCVYMSSAKVYGERSHLRSDGCLERYGAASPVAPEGPYGESKVAAERLLTDGCRTHGIALTILRPPLVYGPGVRGNLRSLLSAIVRGLPLPLASIGNRRALLHRASLIDVVMRAVTQRERAAGVFTLQDLEVSTPGLIRLMAAGLGIRARLFPFPVRGLRALGAVTGTAAAVSRLTDSFVLDAAAVIAQLGWQPHVDPATAWAEIGAQFRHERA